MDELISNPKHSEVRNAKRQEELNQKIKTVAEYVIKTQESSRKTASKFGISAPTVLSYCKKYIKMYPAKSKILEEILDLNKEQTIDNEEVKRRILQNAKLILDGKTVEEISRLTGLEYWIIYRDITTRLEKIDVELSKKLKVILEERRINNLNNSLKR